MESTADHTHYSPPRKRSFRLTAGILAISLAVASALLCPAAVSGQNSGMVIRVASGFPAEVPADNQSETVLELDLDSCNFGLPVSSDGTFSLSISTTLGTIDPPFATSMDGGEFPPRLTLRAGSTTGAAVVEVIASYCPAGAVVLMGVCVDQSYQDATCIGTTTVEFITPGAGAEEAAPPPAEEPDQSGSETSGAQSGDRSQPEGQESSSPDSLAALYQDLEEYLAGEGITAPTPEAMATSGIALTTLLAGWLLLNQLSGISAERSLEAIQAWRRGEVPPEEPYVGAEVDELPPDPGALDESGESDQPPGDKHTLTGESAEDRALRGVKDAQDLDDALKQTRKDFESFESKVPDSVKNSQAWKDHVEPKIKQVKDLLQKGELDKGRTWLDRTEQLVKLRQDVDRDLDHLPADQREAIVWTERTLKTLGHFASDTYQTMVVDPAKAAGEKVLPAEQAQKWNKAMDELNQELSNVAQGIGELPRRGAELMTHGNLQEQADQMLGDSSVAIREEGQMIKDLHGEREVPVEYPDFMGKGTRKVRELWDHTMRCLFHDR